ncbi:hypothetical protein M0657_005637 [Pyricularia oryzae]|uniref:Uncharacterized protein n=1 Tax=Pyricularia oryzae TaxID=318829 RepID=A0A4P7N5C3_PYROR|nr:hypothetical protein M9X92_006676 [Pyricularia oryzae]KAI7922368.1 hypothetical protein M0657_005637 [Pyricularia oryzae]QBZ57747.1 hypothetical protein PoMZ_02682 [Pyricularia oryzae]
MPFTLKSMPAHSFLKPLEDATRKITDGKGTRDKHLAASLNLRATWPSSDSLSTCSHIEPSYMK